VEEEEEGVGGRDRVLVTITDGTGREEELAEELAFLGLEEEGEGEGEGEGGGYCDSGEGSQEEAEADRRKAAEAAEAEGFARTASFGLGLSSCCAGWAGRSFLPPPFACPRTGVRASSPVRPAEGEGEGEAGRRPRTVVEEEVRAAEEEEEDEEEEEELRAATSGGGRIPLGIGASRPRVGEPRVGEGEGKAEAIKCLFRACSLF